MPTDIEKQKQQKLKQAYDSILKQEDSIAKSTALLNLIMEYSSASWAQPILQEVRETNEKLMKKNQEFLDQYSANSDAASSASVSASHDKYNEVDLPQTPARKQSSVQEVGDTLQTILEQKDSPEKISELRNFISENKDDGYSVIKKLVHRAEIEIESMDLLLEIIKKEQNNDDDLPFAFEMDDMPEKQKLHAFFTDENPEPGRLKHLKHILDRKTYKIKDQPSDTVEEDLNQDKIDIISGLLTKFIILEDQFIDEHKLETTPTRDFAQQKLDALQSSAPTPKA